MVCVKPQPLHLVFYLKLGESRNIIPGICLCRMAGSRMVRGFERCRGERRAAWHDSPRRDLGLIDVPREEATRGVRGPQGMEMVQLRWMGVGGEENEGRERRKIAGLCKCGQQRRGFRWREDLRRGWTSCLGSRHRISTFPRR